VARKVLVIALNLAISVGFIAVAYVAVAASVNPDSWLSPTRTGWVGGFLLLTQLLMVVLAVAHVPLCVSRRQPTLGAQLLRHHPTAG